MKVSKDALNTKYMLQHLENYPDDSMIFVCSPDDECEIAQVVEIKQVNLKENGNSLGHGKFNAFLLVTGDKEPLTVQELGKLLGDLPENSIAIMKLPQEEGFAAVVSSQPERVKKETDGFSLYRSGTYNAVFFDFNED